MSKRSLVVFTVVLVVFGVVSRFVPHAWNFAPVTAIALAAAAYIGPAYAIGVVLAIMALADISLGTYEWQIMLAVYGSFALSAVIGSLLKRRRTVINVASASVAASLGFFTITNLAVWQFSGMYPHTFQGLSACFISALPFYRGTLLGDLFFAGFLFASFEFAFYFIEGRGYRSSSLAPAKCE